MKVYKYLSVNEHNIENLINYKLYFNKPTKFEDLFDVNLPLKEIDLKIFYEESISFFKERPQLFEKFKKYFESRKIQLDSNSDSISNIISCIKENHIGITCFTDNDTNDYMWKEYAENETGFCLCFETDYDVVFFKDLTKIVYKKDLPEINVLGKDLSKQMKKFTTTKLMSFKEENEYRLLKNQLGLYEYKPESLVSISFGKNNINKREILEILSSKYSKNINLDLF